MPAMKEELFERMLTSIEFVANPQIFGDVELTRQISEHLVKGDLVVIRDAMQTAFAERMFACLDQFSDWTVHEGYEEHFHYHHHNIYDPKLFPPDLTWCAGIFGSDATKDLIQRLSQKNCEREVSLSASLYLPGDHSLPHDDISEDRQVAFIWYLTKDWQSDWGGELFWCRKNKYIPPIFNMLLLFNVSPVNMHFVTTVSPYARSKRMAISGWWMGKRNPEDDETGAANEGAGDNSLVKFI